jgi:hypothetical protein
MDQGWATAQEDAMKELSAVPKWFLLSVATLTIHFSTWVVCQGSDLKTNSKSVAHGDASLAYSALPYITWPKESFETDRSPFIIGVLGKPTEAHVKLLAPFEEGTKQIHGRTVQVRHFETQKEISDCHTLLVMQSCSPQLVTDALKSVRGKSVLTIGETGDFVEAGGVLSVVKSGRDSILELNPRAARRQQLKVDVRLANLSVLIQEN